MRPTHEGRADRQSGSMAERPAVSTLSTPPRARAWRARFLETYRQTGNVRLSADAAGVSRFTPYKAAKADPEFAEQWQQAGEDALDALEAVARQRAMRTSDTLLIFLLKSLRPDRYRERLDVRVEMRREVERIAAAEGLDPVALMTEVERILAERTP